MFVYLDRNLCSTFYLFTLRCILKLTLYIVSIGDIITAEINPVTNKHPIKGGVHVL